MQGTPKQVEDKFQQMRMLLVQAAHHLLSAENSVTEAYETAKGPNELIGTVVDAPKMLREAATLIEAVILLSR